MAAEGKGGRGGIERIERGGRETLKTFWGSEESEGGGVERKAKEGREKEESMYLRHWDSKLLREMLLISRRELTQ